MSLPSSCRFYRNKKFIVSGVCNIGWIFDSSKIKDCIFDAMNDGLVNIKHHLGEEICESRWFNNFYNKNKDILFGENITKDDFLLFDEVEVYGLLIPRNIVDELNFGVLDNKIFAKMIDNGSFRIDL